MNTRSEDARKRYHEVTTIGELEEMLLRGGCISRCVFQNVDFSAVNIPSTKIIYRDNIFMGCFFTPEMKELIDATNLVFSHIDMPYNAFRNILYSANNLYDAYHIGSPETHKSCFDSVVYQHYLSMGKEATDIKEKLARTLHDYSMSDALHDFLSHYDERKVVGVMGGHALLRTDEYFRKIVSISKRLTEAGYLMVSGGGPGAMEATHLGAWMAGKTCAEVDQAFQILSEAPSYTNPLWLDTAFRVRERFPQRHYESLGVPTWLYGHEPATPFATHIAKYFENALREDGILTIAKGGIIYSPGSAGTMQEIFQDAVQNHYLTLGYSSPMAFLDRNYWLNEMPIYPFLEKMVQSGKYKNLILSLSNDIDEVVAEIVKFSEATTLQ